ncbi:protein kinase [Kribbella sp. NPDC056951]|uniref:protein kinase domain-containing protein n=1 Tax=Kribbella sp. NPDC056951 TaxID=3345978 RepID=UPI003628F99E
MAPEDLAGYSLRRRLGSGSAGTLWQVRDLATGRHAVLRRIPVTAIQREEQFRDELIVLQRITHPHIARVLEVRETASEWLVFSQYVVALNLTEVLRRRGPMSPGEIVTLLSPLANALHYLHHCGLTHGHLTAPNILIDVEGRPVLTDATFHTLNLHPRPTPPPDPPSHTADLQALSTIAIQAGGPATLFPPTLFTQTPAPRLSTHLQSLTTPEPINLGEDDDPPPDPQTTTPPPNPQPTAAPPDWHATVRSSDPEATAPLPDEHAPAPPSNVHATTPPTDVPPPDPQATASRNLHATMPPSDPPTTAESPTTAPPADWHVTTPPTSSEAPPPDSHATTPPPDWHATASSSDPEAAASVPDWHATTPPPTSDDDDPIERSRTPLAPAPPKRPAPTAPQPTAPEPSAAKSMPSRQKPRRRTFLPKLARRTVDATPSPLSRLTSKPLTRTHVVHPTSSHLIGTTHVEPAISWSAPPVPIAERRAPDAIPFVTPRRPPISSNSTSEQPPNAAAHGLTLKRGHTRRTVWRRRHTWWARLNLSRQLTELRYRLAHPAYGVSTAIGLGIAVVLGLGLAARAVLTDSDTPTTTSAPATTPTAHPTTPASPAPSLTTPARPTAHPTTPARPPNQTDPATPPTQTDPATPAGPPTQPASATTRPTAPATPGRANATTPPAPRRATVGRSVADWLATLRALDSQRAQAFRTLDNATLDKIYVPGSQPWRSDRALLADYRKQHIHIQGLRIQIDKTTITHQTPTTVTLRTTDHLVAGQAVHESGTRTPLPPGTPTTRLITLTRSPSAPRTNTPTWRITTITPP